MIVTIGFFDDLYIPTQYLPQPSALFVSSTSLSFFLLIFSASDPNERAYFWIPDSTLSTPSELLDTPLSDRMYIDPGEVVRVRVEADDFCDDEPGPTKQPEAGGMPVKREQRRAPYVICVSNRISCYTTTESFPILVFDC